jgi:hypothetical protein
MSHELEIILRQFIAGEALESAPRRRGLRYPLLLLLLMARTLTRLTRGNDNGCDSGYGRQHSGGCSEAGVRSPLRSAGRGVARAAPLSPSAGAPSPWSLPALAARGGSR